MDYPKIIVCDCDGVLTDGKVWISTSGEISKGFCTRDIRAIRELISMGFEFFIVTASSWPGMQIFEQKTGASVIVKRDKGLLNFGDDYIGMGDDSWDIKMLRNAKVKFCPADACEEVLNIPGINWLKTKGGSGCVLDLLATIKTNNLEV